MAGKTRRLIWLALGTEAGPHALYDLMGWPDTSPRASCDVCGEEADRIHGETSSLWLCSGCAVLTKEKRAAPPPSQSCVQCGAADAPSRCGGCKVALYCGSECAKTHYYRHKPLCGAVREAAREAERLEAEAAAAKKRKARQPRVEAARAREAADRARAELHAASRAEAALSSGALAHILAAMGGGDAADAVRARRFGRAARAATVPSARAEWQPLAAAAHELVAACDPGPGGGASAPARRSTARRLLREAALLARHAGRSGAAREAAAALSFSALPLDVIDGDSLVHHLLPCLTAREVWGSLVLVSQRWYNAVNAGTAVRRSAHLARAREASAVAVDGAGAVPPSLFRPHSAADAPTLVPVTGALRELAALTVRSRFGRSGPCTRCGEPVLLGRRRSNAAGESDCLYHSGEVTWLPGARRPAFSCCGASPGSRGCESGRHKAPRDGLLSFLAM